MSIFSSITRDHAIFVLLVSSIVSLLSSVIIMIFNTRKDRQLQDFYTKQEFYVEFMVHQIIANNSPTALKTLSADFQDKIKLLNAEMLVKADIEIIREIIKLRKIAANSSDREKVLLHVTHIINKFRNRSRNKPITPTEFKQFMELVYHQPEKYNAFVNIVIAGKKNYCNSK